MKMLMLITLVSLHAIFLTTLSFASMQSYLLGARDVITVSIFAGGEEQVAVDLTLSDQGLVNFPFIGSVKAGGLASSELEANVSKLLAKDYFVDPQVHIRVTGYHSLHFSISGAVTTPGNYEMNAATTIMDLIARAEGVTQDRGNIAYILRDVKEAGNSSSNSAQAQDGENRHKPLTVNLLQLLDEGDIRANIALVPGDAVYIPLAKGLNQAKSKVYVSGMVKKPDLYSFQPGLTALGVCIMAGGFRKHAAPNRTTIMRFENGKQEVIKLNLEQVIKGKVSDLALKPGDRIHVPESWL